MTFSQLDLSFSHSYGVVNGMFLAALVFLAFFSLSYLRTDKNQSVAKALLISIFMFVLFGLYNLSFQYLHGAITTQIFPAYLMHYGVLAAPLALLVTTYLIQRYVVTQSLTAYRLIRRLRPALNILYLSYIICLILLFIVDSTHIKHLVTAACIIPAVCFGLYFYSQILDGNINKFFLTLFAFYLVSSTGFTWTIYTQANLPPTFMLGAHALLSLSVLAAAFAIIRYGYKGAYNYGQVRKIDPLNLVNDIYPGIDKGQFYMVYQPKKHLSTDCICGTEALIRWQHPDHGFIAPADFISIAEKTKQINTLCKWSITQVVQQAKIQHDQGYHIPISINFSVMSLNTDVVSFLLEQIDKHNLPTSSIMIEITESLMLEITSRVKDAINLLHESEINISLDDYGTGFSSLSYLRQLYVSELKIDRIFIKGITKNADNQAIAESTIQMARKMGIQVVAEGVEDAASSQLLIDNNCDIIQGYYLSKPMTAEFIMPWLAHHQTLDSHID